MLPVHYTTEQVKAYREKNCCSVMESLAHHKQQNLLLLVRTAKKSKDIDMLFDIVEDLIMRAKF